MNTASVQPPANYQLAGGDTVIVRVFREPDMDSQQRLSRDGTINLPLLGIVRLAGKTTNEAAATIAGLLAPDYILHPQVSVSISAYNKQQFTVLGQVNTPGTYVLPEEQQNIDILAAVARAGGFTRLAKLSEVVVRRNVEGREQTFTVDVNRMMRDKGTARFAIQPNDTISVPERFF
ncbi:MAG: polysaccharide export protein [Rhodospirillales bacterium]|nr:polysaccharide export protein [Acetobacter sp.]